MSSNPDWVKICRIEDIVPETGVCALVKGRQVAVFRVQERLYGLSNYCPFSKANVISRGILGDKNGILKVASPLYKHNFALETGESLDDPNIKLERYPVQVEEGWVKVLSEPKA